MMNKFKLSVLTIFLLSISLPRIQAQTNVRAYEKWEATQFVAVSGHQPEDYVLADNNWEIIYNPSNPQLSSSASFLRLNVLSSLN